MHTGERSRNGPDSDILDALEKLATQSRADMATLKIPVTQHDHIRGLARAPVTLVEYGDYECPIVGWPIPS